MYEYKYVALKREGGFVTRSFFEEYRECIDSYAAQGWRYVDNLSVNSSFGGPTEVILVFEREI